jgi:hypothetical protein
MAKWIGAVILAVTLTFGSRAAISPALATPLPATLQKSLQNRHTDNFSARRVRHQHRYAYRPYDRPYYPAYYDRPLYYAPAAFSPFLGLGYGPWW